jgi:hypothetical protein
MVEILHNRPTPPPRSGALLRGGSDYRSLLLVLAVLLGALSIPAWNLADNPSWWPLIGIGTATSALCLIYILHSAGFEWQSGPVAYLLLLWLFHFPLTLLALLGANLDSSLPRAILSWLESSDWYRASAYANTCAAGFVLGCLFARRRWGAVCKVVLRPNRELYYTGMATAILAACGLAALFMGSGGKDVFSMSYGSLYNTLFGSAFTTACYMVTVGVTMATLNSTPEKRWLPLTLQCAVTIVTLLTGARQYALIGAVVLVVIAAKGGLRIRPVFLLCGAILALLLVSFVGARRGNGVLTSDSDVGKPGPTAALAEMGGSLETVNLVIGWIEGGDQLQWGGGYWLPIERGVGLVVPGLRKHLSTDPRAMSEVMLSRVSGLGGSVVAESFYNFGVAGGAVFVIFGYLLGYVGLRARSPAALAFGGVVLYALTLEIRNWFLSVPAMIVVGTIPIIIGLCFRGRERRRTRQVLPFGERRVHQLSLIGTRGGANNS